MLSGKIYRNPSIDFLIKKALERKEVIQSKSGALVVYTGKYTGRSPQDKFIVDTPKIHSQIDWNKINLPILPVYYQKLYKKIKNFFSSQTEIFIVNTLVGAEKKYSLKLQVICQYAYQALFATYLFRSVPNASLRYFKPDLTVYCAPSLQADPKTDGTHSEAFIILNIEKKTVIIGGTKYAGEIKKSVFTYLNYLLPQKGIFPMHCSANTNKKGGNTALFFGLSGTGKTTLSADLSRRLIGDDEHGWSKTGVFNFEGGCYAKCINIKKESEPQIWEAIHRQGALVENVVLNAQGEFNFDDDSITENTRSIYPLDFIPNFVKKGMGGKPKYVIFLTADATGTFPPVAHLTLNQAAYHFLSGYTSRLAGTERGVKEPQPTFSAYFSAPFMPLKPIVYLSLLQNFLKKYAAQTFLVNTGWTAGPYGLGHRIPISETRAIISAILNGQVEKVKCRHDKIFNLFVPVAVPGVDPKIMDPSVLWKDKNRYNENVKKLAQLFIKNFQKFPGIPDRIRDSGPKINL